MSMFPFSSEKYKEIDNLRSELDDLEIGLTRRIKSYENNKNNENDENDKDNENNKTNKVLILNLITKIIDNYTEIDNIYERFKKRNGDYPEDIESKKRNLGLKLSYYTSLRTRGKHVDNFSGGKRKTYRKKKNETIKKNRSIHSYRR